MAYSVRTLFDRFCRSLLMTLRAEMMNEEVVFRDVSLFEESLASTSFINGRHVGSFHLLATCYGIDCIVVIVMR